MTKAKQIIGGVKVKSVYNTKERRHIFTCLSLNTVGAKIEPYLLFNDFPTLRIYGYHICNT